MMIQHLLGPSWSSDTGTVADSEGSKGQQDGSEQLNNIKSAGKNAPDSRN
jgi:hypothetical protein